MCQSLPAGIYGVDQSMSHYCVSSTIPAALLPVNLSTDHNNKLHIYQEHFEQAYIDSTRQFYTATAATHLADNGVQTYMTYVSV